MKWFMEIVRNEDNLYSATMYLDGVLVEGLPRDISYRELKKAIQEQTKVELVPCKDLVFQTYNPHNHSHQWRNGNGNLVKHYGKQYAYLDNTQPRNDSRVILYDVLKKTQAYYPLFLMQPEKEERIYVTHRNFFYEALQKPFVMICRVEAKYPVIKTDLLAYPGRIDVTPLEIIYADGSRETCENQELRSYNDLPLVYEKTEAEAMHVLQEETKKMERMLQYPKKYELRSRMVGAYAEAVDVEKLSDRELVELKALIKDFHAQMSVVTTDFPTQIYELQSNIHFRLPAIDQIHEEMYHRFERMQGEI